MMISTAGTSTFRRSRHVPRRGAVLLWTILLVPVIAILIVVITDLANLWLARTELKNALDAAALSAVKTWGEGGTTAQARLDANDAFAANSIVGMSSTLDTTEGGCSNGNVAGDGEIVLGSVAEVVPGFEFDCDGMPACFAGDIEVVFAVDTNPISPDTATEDTFERAYSFRIESFTFTPPPGPPIPAPTLDSVTVDLSTLVTTDSTMNPDGGYFDFRLQPPSSDNQSGMDCTSVTIAPTCPIATGFATGGATVSGSNASVNATQTSLTVSFNGLDPGDTIGFGADTDYVGPDLGNMGSDVADDGDEFGGGFVDGAGTTVTGAQVTVVIAGQSFSGFLTAIPPSLPPPRSLRSEVTISGSFTASGTAFGARVRKTVAVDSISSALLGGGMLTYDVTGESYARFSCTTGPPQLIHVETFTCTCP